MRRFLSLTLALTCMLCLSACRRETGAEQPEPTATAAPESVLAASASDAAGARQNHVPPASGTDTPASAPDQQAYGTALGYVGQPLTALTNAIGSPERAEYSASCEQEGAEDGMLYYAGFSVWTMRTATGEIVRAVYPDE